MTRGLLAFDMQFTSFPSLWMPRIPLNTDIVPIGKASVPTRARLYSQHVELGVEVGAAVRTGQRLAADLVSPVTGTVADVGPLRGHDGLALTAVSIEVADKDEVEGDLPKVRDFGSIEKTELVAALSDLGFHIDVPERVATGVINCLDLDPVVTVNQQAVRKTRTRFRTRSHSCARSAVASASP